MITTFYHFIQDCMAKHYDDNMFYRTIWRNIAIFTMTHVLQDYMAKHNNLYDDTCSRWCLRLAITTIVFCRWGWPGRHYDDNMFYRTIWRNITIFTMTHVLQDYMAKHNNLYDDTCSRWCLRLGITTIVFFRCVWSVRNDRHNNLCRTGWQNITITPVPLDITMGFYIIR